MTHEETVDFILYERLKPIIDSFNCFNFEDGDVSVIRKLRELYTVWIDETKERILCHDFIEDDPDCFFCKCESLLSEEIGKCIIYNRINVHDFYEMLSQMRISMLKDKYNPFFKLKIVEQRKLEIEKDFQ